MEGTTTPAPRPDADRALPLRWLAGCGAAFLACVLLLLALDLDVSPHRYLRNDVLFRGADSIESIHGYPSMDPSPFSVALPADLFAREELRRGRLPLWDRTQGGGYPTVAQGNLGVLFPLRALMLPLPPHQAHSAFLLATLALCFAGALLWLHELPLPTGAAALGAGLFTFSGLMLSLLPFDGVAVLLFLPWLLWAWRRFAERPGRGRFAALVLLFALSFSSGHHMLLASVFVGVALLAGLEALARGRLRAFLGLGLAGLWGAAGAALVLLPFALHLGSSWGYKTDSAHGQRYVVPDLAGWLASVVRALLDTGADLLDSPSFYGHLGLVPTALAALGAWWGWRERRLRFLAPALGLAFLLCLPGPWMAPLAQLPPLTWIRSYYLLVALWAVVALAAAVGFDGLSRRLAGRLPRAVLPAAALLVVAAVLLRGLHFFVPVPAEPLPESAPYRLLRQDPERFRITSIGGQSHLPNIASLTGLEDLRLIAVAHNRRYHEWFQLVDPRVLDKSFATSRVTNALASPLVGAFNVKYVVAGKVRHHVYLTQLRPGDRFGPFDPAALPVSVDGRPVYEDRHLALLRVEGAYRPRAFLAERVHPVAPGVEQAVAFLRAHPDAPRAGVVVEAPEALHAALAAGAGPAGEVALEYPSHREAVLRVRARRDALVVLNDVFERGWRATVDGAPAAILPVNVVARGVRVPAGQHVVRMRYHPPGFAAGAAVSGAAFALLGAWLLAARARQPSAESSSRSTIAAPSHDASPSAT